MNQVFLWGFMASGKSYWSKKFSDDLGLNLVDLDELIESSQGLSISEIFTQLGEDHFRQLERAALQQAVKSSNSVIACGGGTPLFHDQFREMNSTGLTIFIDEEWDKMESRLKSKASNRPLAVSTSSLKSLYLSRCPTYKKAHCIFKPGLKEYKALLSLIRNSYLLS